jgi:hypothetical protein
MAKKKQTKPRKYAPRQTRKFQLRLDHAEDAHVRDVLDFCRGERREVTVIRHAINLYWALEQGNLEALFDVFPQYKAQFAPNTAEALEQFMQILQRQQFAPTVESAAGPKQIAAPNFAMPIFEEDDEPTVLIRASTSTDSSLNFVTALRSMQ